MTEATIVPALTPDEWARADWHARQKRTARGGDDGRPIMAADFWSDRRFDAVIALANDVRPADDPGKITREDEAKLRDWRMGAIGPDHAEWSANLIAKLAALLRTERT